MAVDESGHLSFRSPPGASQNDRVFVAMLKLRTDIMMGTTTEIVSQLLFDASCPEQPPEGTKRH